MHRIEINKKTGFQVRLFPVSIYDNNGLLFYHIEEETETFNLPKGVYYTEDSILELDEPVIYYVLKLPKPDRDFSKCPKIEIKPDKHTASIYLREGLIIIDPSILKKGKLYFDWIKYHEIGHFQYTEEIYADHFSIIEMLKEGYNPNQLVYVQDKTLKGGDREERINYLHYVLDYE
jgi:hypothetical protein